MKHEETAAELFKSGYSCSQAVLAAFCDQTGLDRETALMLASSFGAGMGRLRETCGAVTGMFMVAGLLWGCGEFSSGEDKAAHYALIQKLAADFKGEHQTICCRELLAGLAVQKGAAPEARTAQYYKTRPCEQFVRTAARLLDIEIEQRGEPND